jgi:hypothetical protein
MKAKQELKNQLEELEKKLKNIGDLSLKFIAHRQMDYGKDHEWELAVAINQTAHKAYNDIQKIKN